MKLQVAAQQIELELNIPATNIVYEELMTAPNSNIEYLFIELDLPIHANFIQKLSSLVVNFDEKIVRKS